MTFDPDFGKSGFARKLFRIRFRGMHHLPQRAFAERFGLAFQTVRDLEQARSRPTLAMAVLVEAIRLNPALIAKAARNVAADPECTCFPGPE